jgi:hypothetical protein
MFSVATAGAANIFIKQSVVLLTLYREIKGYIIVSHGFFLTEIK